MRALDLPARPWIVGHRGVREALPENTVESVLEAVAQKADMVELDLQLSGDGHLVAYHDMALPLSGEEPDRRLGELTLEEIKRCRPVWAHREEERPYEVSTLAEVLEAAPAGLPLNLEIKRWEVGGDPSPLVAALAATVGDREQLLVSSFDLPALVEVGKTLPDLPVAPLGNLTADWQELLEAARRLQAFSIHVHRLLAAGLARKGRLEEPEAKERPILAYTVNNASEARRLRESGVAGFFTDHPAALRAGLERPR